MTTEDDLFSDESAGQALQSPRLVAASFFEFLFQFFRQTEIHEASNQIFERCLQNLLSSFAALRRLPGFEEINVGFRGEQIYVNQTRMRPKARQFRQHRFLLRFMRGRQLGALNFPKEIQKEALLNFLWAVANFKGGTEESIDSLNSDLQARGLAGYRAGSLKRSQMIGEDEKAALADMEVVALALYERLRKFVEVSFDNLDKAKNFEIGEASSYVKDLCLLGEEDLMNVFRSNLMKRRDRPLSYLAVDSCLAAIAWGRSLGLPSGVLVELGGAALAHPWIYVLRSSSEIKELTLRESIGIGALLDRLKEVWPLPELQRLSLFEWTKDFGKSGIYDWQGTKCYLHFFSRMVRIVAVFKSLTHYEKGKDLYLPDEAMTFMLQQNEKFDPTLLKLFVNWMGIYPIGSFIQLRSGEIGQVFAAGADPLKFQRPIVVLFTNSDSRPLQRPQLLDLSEMNEKLGVFKKSILKSLPPDQVNIPEELLNMAPVSL